MTSFGFFLITLAVACLGGIMLTKLRVPAGYMVGAMAAVVAFSLLSDRAVFYAELKVPLQIVSGALIGCKVGKEDLLQFKVIVWPTVVLICGMVILNVGFGTLIAKFSALDIATALFATTPGGVSDMALICEDLGADPGYVAILQVIRLLIIYSFCPPIFKKIMSKSYADQAPAPSAGDAPKEKPKIEWVRLSLLFVSCTAFGLLFNAIGVTAGAMVGSMVGGALYTVFTRKTYFPKKLRYGLQIGSGAFIGIKIGRDSIAAMGTLLIPILIMTVGILAFVFVTSWIMHKLTGLDYPTCMFASTPGGLQEMSLLAEELGADTLKVAVMQTMRLVFVVSLFPTMISVIVRLLG